MVTILSYGISALVAIMIVLANLAYCIDGRNSKAILIALEAAFVVQLTYFSLMNIGKLNPLFITMAQGLKYSSGFDLSLVEKSSPPRNLLGIGVESSSFADNATISLISVLLCLIIGGAIFLIDKLILSKKGKYEEIQGETEKSQMKIN